VSPRAGLDRCEKSRPHRGFDLRTVQPVASRYTDWATRMGEGGSANAISSAEISFCGIFKLIIIIVIIIIIIIIIILNKAGNSLMCAIN
jgi:hypothetical protein